MTTETRMVVLLCVVVVDDGVGRVDIDDQDFLR